MARSSAAWITSKERRFSTAGFAIGLALALIPGPSSTAFAQARQLNEFQLTKITRILITTPDYAVGGSEQFPTDRNDEWLAIEVEFTAAPEFTDELTIKYFVFLNGKILTGEVTHANVTAGRERRSIMYVAPRTLARLNNNQAVTPTAVKNVAVQILQHGTLKSELSLARARPQWYTAIPNVAGFMLNKNETPFAPLYWDRYEQIKTPGR